MDRYSEILAKFWGYSDFRPLQEEIIRSVASDKDTLGLMPTGSGKSITFQVYSLSTDGICLVITPLIALIKDQVENLRIRKIKVLAVYSGMTRREIDIVMNNAVYGDYKFLYVSPERLTSNDFREKLARMRLNLITVDEAHCISQWGYDFRPSYLRIAEIRELLPRVPVLALTATATAKVLDDIQDKLLFKEKNVLKKNFRRNNLIYLVREKDDKLGYLVNTVLKAKGSGIIYVSSRKKSHDIALLLQQQNISADFYHAGLRTELRSLKQDRWMKGEIQVMVATNAFGLGIDKPDVRFVIHFDLPDSLEAYSQETGRAGRDGKKSAAVTLYNRSDKIRLHKMVTNSFPPIDTIKKIYSSIGNYLMVAVGAGKESTYDFRLEDFAEKFKFQPNAVYHTLRILERQGYLEYIDNVDSRSRLYFITKRDDLYKIQTETRTSETDLDNLVKLILRSYAGLFNDYVNIDEQLLAVRAGLTPDDVYQNLKKLAQMKVIHYIPRRKLPVIVYNTERIEGNRIQISHENYKDRKLYYQSRVDRVLKYASQNEECRIVNLMKYFDYPDSDPCGYCDICTGEHESGITVADFNRISGKITALLESESQTIRQIILIAGELEKSVLGVCRWMLDNGMILSDSNGVLSLKPI